MQAFPNFGALTETIKFQRRNADGNWSDYFKTRAELIPDMAGEVIKADSVRPTVKVRFRMRYVSLLSRTDPRELRVLHGKDIYNVIYVEDDRNRHVQMYVACAREDR